MNENNYIKNLIINGISGSAAAFSCDFSYYPLDTIKTRIQASNSNNTSFFKNIKIMDLFKGSSILFVMSIPAGFMYFLGYELGKSFIIYNNIIGNEHLINIGGAISAEFFNTLSRTPFETVKQQVQIGLNNNIRNTIISNYKTNGIKGFYSGFYSMLLREVPYSCFQLSIYEFIKKKFKNRNRKKNLKNIDMNIKQSSITGIFAGSISAFMTVPMDVVKTKMMTDRNDKYTSIKKTINLIIKEEGVKGLMKGWYIRTFMIGLTSIPFFVSYEMTKQSLKKYLN